MTSVPGAGAPVGGDGRALPVSPFDDWLAPMYTVGQVASMLQVQPAFLRRLDSESVVCPARSDGGQRRYSRVEVEQVAQVASLASEGLTLAGIRRLLALEHEVARLRGELAAERERRGARDRAR